MNMLVLNFSDAMLLKLFSDGLESFPNLSYIHINDVLHRPEVSPSPQADEDADPLSRPAVRWTLVGVFVCVAAVGMLANTAVLYTVTVSRRLRAVTGNVFVACLAVSDLWLCVFSGPIQLHYQLTNRWAFGLVLCRIVFAAFAVPVYVSALSILWIAIDRYRLIVRPLAQRWSPRTAIFIVAASVLLSVVLAAPVNMKLIIIIIIIIYLNNRNYCRQVFVTCLDRKRIINLNLPIL
jgi:neuropeptide Y receptor